METSTIKYMVVTVCIAFLAACANKRSGITNTTPTLGVDGVVTVYVPAGVTMAATPTQSKPAKEGLDELMAQAAATEEGGQKESALQMYQEAAKLYPASKLPLLKIAQMHFDFASYGKAIVAAEQVIARDSLDRVAHSILSVSGLRIATKAVRDLSQQNELNGSVRTDAQDLARVLRQSLGEGVLVPVPAQTQGQTPVQAFSSQSTTSSQPTSVVTTAPATFVNAPRPSAPPVTRPKPPAAKPPASSSAAGNPFGVLR